MSIPAEASFHPIAPHCPVPGNHIFDDARQEVPVVRAAGWERRAVVEDILPVDGSAIDRLCERVGFAPEVKDSGFHLGDIDRR